MAKPPSSSQPPQNVAVVLRIGSGSFDDGFTVTLQILEDGRIIQEYDDLPRIPDASEMPALYQEWQDLSLEGSRRLQAVPEQVTNVSEEEENQKWKQRAERLKAYCMKWFRNQAFSSLSAHIRANEEVRRDRSVPIIIRCDTGDSNQNQLLRRLPWHFWDLFTNLDNAEFALFTRSPRQVVTLKAPVRVLAIFGSAHGGLRLEQDAKALETLRQRGAEIVECSEPSEQELSRLLFDQAWDILAFAGHSSSTTDATSHEGISGQIQIRENVFLHLDDLHPGLTRAVRNGLKLAIFNSCDGLGIAEALARSNVPAMIVYREPVPDQIAGQFLFYFLEEFSQGRQLCLAVREARERLRLTEGMFPAASWLPVVCINPQQPELVWPAAQPLSHPQPPSLLSRLLPCLRRHYYFLIGLGVLLGLIALASPTVIKGCQQIFPLICASPVEQFISSGEKPIADSRTQLIDLHLLLKQQGIAAFAEGRYGDAVRIFDDLRNLAEQNRNDPSRSQPALAVLQDPEILIYRNNAFVNDRHRQNPSLPIYTIAVAAPLNLDAGTSIVLGVAQAQDVAVKQGINLQVVIANDSNNPAQAEKVAESLSQNPRILAVVGHYTSPNTCAALKVYSPSHLAVVAPTSTTVDLKSNSDCGGDSNNVFFRTVSTTRVEANTLVRYLINDLKTPQPKVVAFYNSKELFSQDLYHQFVQVLNAYGGTVTATFDLADPTFDARQLPPQVSEADALAVLPDGGTILPDSGTGDATAFQKAIEILKLNNGEKPVLGANTLYLQNVVDQAGDALVDRLFVAVDWHPKQCGAAAFAKQINDYWGGDLNRRTALAYEAVQAVLQAISLSSNSPVTRQEIRQKLSETGIREDAAASSAILEGVSISFDARGDRREITTRAIVTVNEQLRFDLVKDVPCSSQQ
ncbi:MAG: ABC transporter substrate-binding protein [Cyanobacteria bacterium CRU_2_1]|nr:ABC transporter substrate-binding protein [Cyanobacteria bacterium RU_5_0]NJR59625.1 ABC transporter substrate-binding protein [Cyanobacteria bacterium CRU_2_1]